MWNDESLITNKKFHKQNGSQKSHGFTSAPAAPLLTKIFSFCRQVSQKNLARIMPTRTVRQIVSHLNLLMMYNYRIFRGNHNYVSLYNSHILEVFNYPQDNFKESKIANDVRYCNQPGYQRFPGSRWSSEEKNMFFHYLARYSIHRLDLIADSIPTKTSMEILQYYHTLKRSMQKYKKVKKTHLKGKKFYYKHVSSTLVPYNELPIAYEMSENWIKAEESQSLMIFKKERIMARDEAAKFPGAESELIDLNMVQRWNEEMEKYGGVAAKMDYKSVKLYEKQIYLMVRELVIDLISRGVHEVKKTDLRGAFLRDEKYEPLVFAPKTTMTSINDLPKLSKVVEDEYLEEELFRKETEALESQDAWESRGHEHIILTFLTTANYEKVKNLMYTDEEVYGEAAQYGDKFASNTPKSRVPNLESDSDLELEQSGIAQDDGFVKLLKNYAYTYAEYE